MPSHSRSRQTSGEMPRSLSTSQIPSDLNGLLTPRRPSFQARGSSAWRRSAWLSDAISRGAHSGTSPRRPHSFLDSPTERSPLLRQRSLASLGSYETRVTGGKGYDDETEEAVSQALRSGGLRSWYANFSSIDWLHDEVKAAHRRKALRQLRGWRKTTAMAWDRLQGWLLVVATGVITAFIALFIIRSEMVLYDFKDGYCSGRWLTAKRFCCPAETPDPRRSSLVALWRKPKTEGCDDWRSWQDVFSTQLFSVEFVVYTFIAVAVAVLASVLTVYLTSSDAVFSSKDAIDPTNDLGAPIDEKAAQPQRKTLLFAAGSGISEGFTIRGYLGGRTLVVKAVGLTLSVASGLSLGKEGPFVHIASCVANILSRFSPQFDRNEARRRELLSAACAAGVSVSFGAPVGGVLFSLEEVSYFFPTSTMMRSFVCAMVAFIVLRELDPFGSGKVVLFETTFDRETAFAEYFGFVALGVFGGLFGAAFCAANAWWSKNVRRGTALGRHPIVEVALVTALTACFAFTNRFTHLGGTELVAELFSECQPGLDNDGLCVDEPSKTPKLIGQLAITMAIKILLTTITFGLRLPAGVFIPSLAVGALFGRGTALAIELLYEHAPHLAFLGHCDPSAPFGQRCSIPAVWSIVGAASTLAGVTRTTISLAVIVFELTSNLTYVAPVMLGVLIAKTVGDTFDHRSVYDLVLAAQDLPYLDAKIEPVWDHSTLSDAVDTSAPTIVVNEENTIGSLRQLLLDIGDTSGGAPILIRDEAGLRPYSYIAARELATALSTVVDLPLDHPITFIDDTSTTLTPALTPGPVDFGRYTDHAPLTVSINTPLEIVHSLFVKLGVRYLIVTDQRGLYNGLLAKERYLAFVVEHEH